MRKKHPEHVNLERWLVSYADFITLLFAFFVIMYAMSQADLEKFKKVTSGIRAAFSSGPVGMIDLGAKSGGNTANPFENIENPGGRVMNLPAGKTNTAADEDPELQEMKELLEETVSLELGATDMSEKLQLQFDSRGLIVRVATKDFFNPGEEVVRADLRPVLDRIGRVLSKSKRLFRIEGHVDPEEVQAYGIDPWKLSSERAAWVARYWMTRFDMDPKRLGIAAYATYRPLSQGKDVFAHARNRRVEVIILNNRYEVP